MRLIWFNSTDSTCFSIILGVRQNSLFIINDAEKIKENINLISQIETNSPLVNGEAFTTKGSNGVRGIERNIKSIEIINKVKVII